MSHVIGLRVEYWRDVYAPPFTRDLIFSSSALYSQPKALLFEHFRFFLWDESFGRLGLISVEPRNPFLFASNQYMAKNFL